MNFETIKTTLNATKKFMITNSHTIKSALAMVGVGWTAYESYSAYPEVQRRKEEAEKEKGGELTKVETAVAVAPAFARPATVLAATETLILSANKDATSKIIAAGTIAAMNKKKLEEFVEEAKGIVGEKKVSDIKSEITRKHFDEEVEKGGWNWPENPEDGKYWWRDELTGQMFRSNTQDVELAIAKLEANLAAGEIVEYDEFAWQVGIKNCGASKCAYWDPVDGLRIRYEINYIKGPKGEPAAEIVFDNLSFR